MKHLKLYFIIRLWQIYLTLKTDWYFVKGKLLYTSCYTFSPIGVLLVGGERYVASVVRICEWFQYNLQIHKARVADKTAELANRSDRLKRDY